MSITGGSVQDHTARLLIVDDEQMVLDTIRSLLQIETDYVVACSTDPQQALKELGHDSVDLVIADYLMHSMDGIEFLKRVKELHPEATRVLLTGYADKDSAIKAINQVGLFQYVEKPWDNNDLLLIIRNGLERRFLIKELQEKVSELGIAHSDIKEGQTKLLKAFI